MGTNLRSSEKRTKKARRSGSPKKLKSAIDVATSNEYQILRDRINELEEKRMKLRKKIDKILAPFKESSGIFKLEDQIYTLTEQLGDLFDEKERVEKIVLDELVIGKSIANFSLRTISKRFSISYKAICEEVFRLNKKAYEEMRAKFGGRKEQFILIFKGEELPETAVDAEDYVVASPMVKRA